MLEVIQTERNITVGLVLQPNHHFGGTVNLDRCPTHWWVSRVVVAPQYRRQRWGARMLRTALDLVAKTPGPHRVVVCPGGYNTPEEVQDRFYRSLGFRWHNDEYMWVDLTGDVECS